MAQIPGTVIAAAITTGDTTATYSIGNTNEMQGGHHQVADIAARDAIPAARRSEGMLCWVIDTQQLFRLVGGIENANWELDPSSTAAEAAARIFADGTVAQQGSQLGLILRDQGTNYTNEQVAIAVFNVGSSGSEYAYALYVTGTNYSFGLFNTGSQYTNTRVDAEAASRAAADDQVFANATDFAANAVAGEASARITADLTVAQQGSLYTHQNFVAGTNYTDSKVQEEASLRASYDLAYYWAGTNYTNEQVITAQTVAGSESLALYYAGTAYTDARVNAEAAVRSGGDTALQTWVGTNRDMINELATILGASFNGTFSLYMAQVSRGKPDTKITVVGGVVTGFEQSPFVWDDFLQYQTGEITSFNKGSSWSTESYGSITTEIWAGTVAQDTLQTYPLGEITALTEGVGFNTDGTFAEPYINALGIDSMESYPLGAIVNPNMDGGTFFTDPAVIFTY